MCIEKGAWKGLGMRLISDDLEDYVCIVMCVLSNHILWLLEHEVNTSVCGA